MSRKRHGQRASRHGYFTEGLMKLEDDLKHAHEVEMQEDNNPPIKSDGEV